jgi:hypothetical protein
MFTILAFVLGTGLVGRELLSGIKPSVLWSAACSTAGFVVCFAAARIVFNAQEQQLFAAECILPALAATIALLWLVRRYLLRGRDTVFF